MTKTASTSQASEQVKAIRTWIQLDCAKAEKEYAFEAMMEHKVSMRLTLERAAEGIANYSERMKTCENGEETRSTTGDIYEFAMNEMQNRVRNMNTEDATGIPAFRD